jgi:hypothetical protein
VSKPDPHLLTDLKSQARQWTEDTAVADLLHELLGCEWGHSIKTLDDIAPCQEQAAQIIVLHAFGEQESFKFCAKHIERVQQETEPHRD